MDHILEFFHSEHDDNLLDVDLQMLQAWLVVAPPSKFYTVSTLLFHKDAGANFSVTNCMSHFSMFVPTKVTVKLANRNMGHAQWIGIILCCFPNCSIIYLVGPGYYFPGHPSNTISSGALKFYIGSKKVTSEPLENSDFVDPQGSSWRSTYQTRNNLDYLQLEIIKINPHRDKNIVVPNVCGISKQTLAQSDFWSCLYHSTKTNGKKRTHGRSTIKSPQTKRALPNLSLDQWN